jgi:hypothetical protein
VPDFSRFLRQTWPGCPATGSSGRIGCADCEAAPLFVSIMLIYLIDKE